MTIKQKKLIKRYKAKMLEEKEREIKSDDYEISHSNGDTLLCELLDELGFSEVVEAYNDLNKWFA